ncbi:hypothetical protein ACC685_37795, partial [Rhizobium ruizarguesonis]
MKANSNPSMALPQMIYGRLNGGAGLSTTGLNNIERGTADPKASNLKAIQGALQEAGIIFLSEGESAA